MATDKELRQKVGYGIARAENVIEEQQALIAHLAGVQSALTARIDAEPEPVPEPTPEPIPVPEPPVIIVPETVHAVPGMTAADLQALVSAAKEGAEIVFDDGVYAASSLVPRRGQRLVPAAPGGALLDGAGSKVFALLGKTTNPEVYIGALRIGNYVGAPLQGIVRAGAFDYPGDVNREAWLREMSADWVMEGTEVFGSRYAGIMTCHGLEMRGVHVHDCGETGITGYGSRVDIGALDGQPTVVEDINQQGLSDTGHEAAGMKLKQCADLRIGGPGALIIRRVKGKGFWTDIDVIRLSFLGGVIEDVTEAAIMHEIGYQAVIQGYVIRRCGFTGPGWGWGAAVCVVNTPDVEIGPGVIDDCADGIFALQQNTRLTGAHGERLLRNLNVHDHQVTIRRPLTGDFAAGSVRGYAAGLNAEPGMERVFDSGHGNRFAGGRYDVVDPGARNFRWQGDRTWTQWRAAGHDQSGSIA